MGQSNSQASGKAKYFCENCGSEVAAKARFCPNCGKFFSSIRCPQCGKMGTVKDFMNGCPACHYAMSHEELYGTPDEDDDTPNTVDGRKHKLSRKSKRQIKNAFKTFNNKTAQTFSDAPVWVFFLGIVLLIIVLGALFVRCQ